LLIKPNFNLKNLNLIENINKFYKVVLLNDKVNNINSHDLIIYSNKDYNYLYNYKDDFYFTKIVIKLKYENNNNKIFNYDDIKNIDLSNCDFTEFIMSAYIKVDLKFPKNIKMIKLSDYYNNNIINLENTNCECFIMSYSFNQKICFPKTLLYLEIGTNYNKELLLPNKLKYLILNNSENNILDFLPNSLEYLKIYNNTMQQCNLDNLPNSIITLSLNAIQIIDDFSFDINYISPNINTIEFVNCSKLSNKNKKYLNLKKLMKNKILIMNVYYSYVNIIIWLISLFVACVITLLSNILLDSSFKVCHLMGFLSIILACISNPYVIFTILIIFVNLCKFKNINKYNLVLINLLSGYNEIIFKYKINNNLKNIYWFIVDIWQKNNLF
jgi:hypothetical protein